LKVGQEDWLDKDSSLEPKAKPETDPADFVQIYSQYEVRLRGYVQSLVWRWSDAEDIMQRCSLVLWKRFGQFEPGTNFFAWACQVVRFEVRKYHAGAARDRMIFSEAVMEAITARTVECDNDLQARIGFLQECVSKLPPDHRELLRLRYDEQRSVGSVAELLKRPLENVYKTLSRIRLALHLCISRRIAAGQP
jgi:RNA polymerase sigma-70 factor, ECF subfamily